MSSLRAYGLNEDLLGEMATVRAGGLTFAPEAGTQRMRDVVAKNVTEEDIIESAHRVFGRGFPRMKLYFMIGLPTEKDEDVRRHRRDGGARAGDRAAPPARRAGDGVGVDPRPEAAHAVPVGGDGRRGGDRAQADAAGERGARAARDAEDAREPAVAHRGDLLARRSRGSADMLEAAFRLGCRFDGWDDALRVELWEQAIAETAARTGLDVGRYWGRSR